MDIPWALFKVNHVDLVGPLEVSNNARYLLTIIDRYSWRPEVFPSGWVSRYGLPDTIISDRGAQFTSALWDNLSKSLGFSIHHTTAYHPQSNGLVERLHRQLKDALRARTAEVNWFYHLPWILLGICTSPKDDSGYSPAQMLYGSSLRIPGIVCSSLREDISSHQLCQDLEDSFRTFVPPPTVCHGNRGSYMPSTLQCCSQVWIRVDRLRPALSYPYEGPYTVLQRGLKTFVVDVKGVQKTVSVDRLKPCISEHTLQDTLHRTRSGRLIKPVQPFQG
ncbi:uncharacterized protein K02A2.6-like [Tigriopus californicus]|uniref:uncharacterized protein K02A2.6-like n=1 Tax=Tigriopus californicus TaxID=6832 RepID=UPI0027D9DA66|nr:uncharacterized protein K02A2.6-like [Tigriopus californicus]